MKRRDWLKYHKPKDLAISIAVEAAELLEKFQWLTDAEVTKLIEDFEKRSKVVSEIADVIYTISLSNSLRVDLSSAV
jgi:dCTP diphosphatase